MACAPGATASEISSRCRAIASLLQEGSTSPAPFLRPGRWRRKYRPNSSSGRAAPKAVSRVSPIGGCPCFSALSELRLETKSLSACQTPLLRPSPPRERESFFKSRRGFLVLRMMARSRRELAKAHMPQLAAERRLGDRDPELLEEPLRQIDQPPAHDAMQGGNRPIFHDLPQGLALALVEDARSARRFAGQETIRTFGVETDNPVAHDLHPDPADPCRIRPRAAIVNLGQRQETPALIGITRSPRQHAQANCVKVRAKRNRSRHGKPLESCLPW